MRGLMRYGHSRWLSGATASRDGREVGGAISLLTFMPEFEMLERHNGPVPAFESLAV